MTNVIAAEVKASAAARHHDNNCYSISVSLHLYPRHKLLARRSANWPRSVTWWSVLH